MKTTIKLTPENANGVLVTNNDNTKAVSLRGLFLLGRNTGESGSDLKTVKLSFVGSEDNIIIQPQVNDAQLIINPGDIFYKPLSGKSIMVQVENFAKENESVYIEADYELLDM